MDVNEIPSDLCLILILLLYMYFIRIYGVLDFDQMMFVIHATYAFYSMQVKEKNQGLFLAVLFRGCYVYLEANG